MRRRGTDGVDILRLRQRPRCLLVEPIVEPFPRRQSAAIDENFFRTLVACNGIADGVLFDGDFSIFADIVGCLVAREVYRLFH